MDAARRLSRRALLASLFGLGAGPLPRNGRPVRPSVPADAEPATD